MISQPIDTCACNGLSVKGFFLNLISKYVVESYSVSNGIIYVHFRKVGLGSSIILLLFQLNRHVLKFLGTNVVVLINAFRRPFD